MDLFNFNDDKDSFVGFNSEHQQEKNDSNFSKTLVGGYSKGSVKKYVQEMQSNARKMQENIEFQLQELIHEKQSLGQENELLKSQIRNAEEKSQNLDSDIERIYSENIEEIKSLNNQKDQLKNELINYKDKYEAVYNNQVSLETEIGNLRVRLDNKVKEIEALQSHLDEVSRQNDDSDFETAVIEMEKKYLEESQKVKNLEEIINAQRNEFNEITQDKEVLISKLSQKIDFYENQNNGSNHDHLKQVSGVNLHTVGDVQQSGTSDSYMTSFKHDPNLEYEINTINKHQETMFKDECNGHRQTEDSFKNQMLKSENSDLREELKNEILDKYRIEKCLSDDLRRMKERMIMQRQEFENANLGYQSNADVLLSQKDDVINQLRSEMMILNEKLHEKKEAENELNIIKKMQDLEKTRAELTRNIDKINAEEHQYRKLLSKS